MSSMNSNAANAHKALTSVLAAYGSARMEGLVRITHDHPDFAPGWTALAEEHMKARRREEALTAAKRAMRLDIDARRRFSPELAEITKPFAPERKPDPEAPAQEPTDEERRRQAMNATRANAGTPAGKALQQASLLVGYHRRSRLEELSEEYPDHAPIWLALAEETLAQRSVEQAMGAAAKAMDRDPSLEAVMSPPLARAWKYHRKEVRRHVTPATTTAPPSEGALQDALELTASTSRAADKPRGIRSMKAAPPVTYAYGGHRPEPQAPTPPVQLSELEERAASKKPRLERMLATALGLRSREERITILQQLRVMDPASDEVLFHLAKELALAERTEDARIAGDALRELSVDRYTELYDWAEKHWAAKARGESLEEEPPPRSGPQLTQVLDGLDAEARLEQVQRAADPAPAPSMEDAADPREPRSRIWTSTSADDERAPTPSAPRGGRERPAPAEPGPSFAGGPASRRREADPVGAGAQRLRAGTGTGGATEEEESTVRVSRPPSAMRDGAPPDHGKENSEFKTVVMKLSDMQRLAEETRGEPAPEVGPAIGDDDESDDTHVEQGPPRPLAEATMQAARKPAPASTRPAGGNRLRQGPPDTRVEARPRGRLPFKNSRPDSELQFQPPSNPADRNDQGGDDIDELLASMMDDDRSANMPTWLSNPRPWAATPDKPTPVGPTRERANAGAKPSPERTGPEPRPRPPKDSAPRAHPRLVRKRPANKGPSHSDGS